MQPSSVYCDVCGASNRPQARFCMVCGQAMATASATGLLPTHSLLKQRYRILYRLGQGGMGAVYKAADTHLGDRPVAVKEMSLKGLDPQEAAEAAADFKREAHMLAGLFQRHLPRIYDHFDEGGRWYLVMDFISGQTLEEYLVKVGGKLPVKEVLDIGIQLATVLDYLHSHQPPIIFRDLKPANVMRTPDGDLFLIDFGIARHFKPGQAKDTVAYGSAGYAAPEPYGKAQTTPQSDIYSVGATLHHLLSGNDPSQSPFRFATLSSTGIPASLSILIAQMLDMDADKRPASMALVKEQLQQLAQIVPKAPPQEPRLSPSLGTILFTYRGHSKVVRTVAWSPNGKHISSGSYDKTVQVWDATTGKGVVVYRGYAEPISAVAWSPNGKHLAFSSGNIVQIWNTTTDKLILTYRGHAEPIFAVAWSPDGNYITSASDDQTVQVSNTTDGKTIFTYKHSAPVYTLAWSPDGTRITFGCGDAIVQVWQAP